MAETGLKTSILTVVLDFKGAHSRLAIGEMKREAERLIEASGVTLDWRIRSEAHIVANNLVVMTFRGACEFGLVPPRYHELGPYAITDGQVQPFGEVDCARVIPCAKPCAERISAARITLWDERWVAWSLMNWCICSPNPSNIVARGSKGLPYRAAN